MEPGSPWATGTWWHLSCAIDMALNTARSSGGERCWPWVGTRVPRCTGTSHCQRCWCQQDSIRGWHCFSPSGEPVLISSIASKRTCIHSGWSGTTDRAGDAGRNPAGQEPTCSCYSTALPEYLSVLFLAGKTQPVLTVSKKQAHILHVTPYGIFSRHTPHSRFSNSVCHWCPGLAPQVRKRWIAKIIIRKGKKGEIL